MTPDYRFSFTITDETTGDAMVIDHCSFNADSVDQFGGCETVDHQVARALSSFKRIRAEHETANYPKNDQQLVTQTADRIRNAARAAGEKIT